jgi:hypothetical protein
MKAHTLARLNVKHLSLTTTAIDHFHIRVKYNAYVIGVVEKQER